MTRSKLFLLTLTLGLTACVNEDNFADKYVEALCKKSSECDDDFADDYDSVSACVDDQSAQMDLSYVETCTYNPDSGKGCVQDIKDTECGENWELVMLSENCTSVYTCEEDTTPVETGDTGA